MNNYLIENELGYTNHYNGKYVTEYNATHIAVHEHGALVIKEYERASLQEIIMKVLELQQMFWTVLGVLLLIWNAFFVWDDTRSGFITKRTLLNAFASGVLLMTLIQNSSTFR